MRRVGGPCSVVRGLLYLAVSSASGGSRLAFVGEDLPLDLKEWIVIVSRGHHLDNAKKRCFWKLEDCQSQGNGLMVCRVK